MDPDQRPLLTPVPPQLAFCGRLRFRMLRSSRTWLGTGSQGSDRALPTSREWRLGKWREVGPVGAAAWPCGSAWWGGSFQRVGVTWHPGVAGWCQVDGCKRGPSLPPPHASDPYGAVMQAPCAHRMMSLCCRTTADLRSRSQGALNSRRRLGL